MPIGSAGNVLINIAFFDFIHLQKILNDCIYIFIIIERRHCYLMLH